MNDAPLYWLDIYSSDDEVNPTTGSVEGVKRFNILSLLPDPQPVGKFRRKGDGSGKAPAQRRVIFKVEFEAFTWHKSPDNQYNDLDDLTDLEFILTQPYLNLYNTNFIWKENIAELSRPYPKAFNQYPLDRRVTWRGNKSLSIDKDNGRIDLDLEFEYFYPSYLPSPLGLGGGLNPFDWNNTPI